MLGQGDFIEYLMDLLGEELCKPAKQIHRHNLVGVLETALRGEGGDAVATRMSTLSMPHVLMLPYRTGSYC
jgi:gamma-tubulin complex component 3